MIQPEQRQQITDAGTVILAWGSSAGLVLDLVEKGLAVIAVLLSIVLSAMHIYRMWRERRAKKASTTDA